MEARQSNACAALTEAEFEELVRRAHQYLDARGPLTRFFESIGDWVERGVRKLPESWRQKLVEQSRDALWWAYNQATVGMDAAAVNRPPSTLLYRLASTGSGALTGAAGLAGVAVDLPASTLAILRSLADLARSKGMDITDPDVRACCIEAFAFGGPTDEDDNADLAFWSSRTAAPELAEMIVSIATRYSSRLALVLPAKAVPVVSAIASAAINWHFLGFFQAMGEVLLSLKPLEQKYGRDRVRSCFSTVVSELRSQRNFRQKSASQPNAVSEGL
jgi:hypothetical protein